MTLSELLALLVVAVAAPLSWIVAVSLWRIARADAGIRVLRERAFAATATALIVTVFAVVFVNNEREIPPLDADATRILTRGSLLLLSVASSAYWLRLYLRRQ